MPRRKSLQTSNKPKNGKGTAKTLEPRGEGDVKRTPLGEFDAVGCDNIYAVERFLARRLQGKPQRMHWQVRWKGHDHRSDMWEPLENLAGDLYRRSASFPFPACWLRDL